MRGIFLLLLFLTACASAPPAARRHAKPRCAHDSDCPAEASCVSGKCYSKPRIECEIDRDCPKGSCNAGICSRSANGHCMLDRDCAGGACNDGVCSTNPNGRCFFDRDCPGGSCVGGTCSHVN